MSSLPARMMLIKSKMKELECSQDFSHNKSMGIFTDAQGQLTPQSLVRSGRISNSSEMLWMSLLPASIIIIIIIMSLFYEDNIFSTITNLTYGPRLKKQQKHDNHNTIFTIYT